MKIVPQLPKKKTEKKKVPDYSSWDPMTQAKYLYDLGQQIGPKITMAEAYRVAFKAVHADS